MKIKVITVILTILLTSYATIASTRSSLLPGDADVFVRISDVSELLEKMETTSFSKLWNDPQVQDALGEHNLQKTFEDSITEGMSEEESKIMIEELKMLKGEIAFAYKISTETFAMVAAMTEEDFKRSLVLDAELKDKGKRIKSVYQGVDVYTDYSEENPKTVLWQAHIDHTLLWAFSEEWLKQTISKIKSSPVVEKKDETPNIIAKARISSILDKTIEESEKAKQAMMNSQQGANNISPVQNVSMRKVFDSLGITKIKDITLSLKFYQDKTTCDSMFTIEKPYTGILSMYDFSPSSLNTQIPYAPQETISYEVGRINLMKLWQSIPQMISGSVPPETAQQLNMQLLGIAGILGVDPGRDIFANLDTQLITTTMLADPEPQSIYYIRLKNEEALQTSLARLFSPEGMLRMQLGESFKSETFRDSVIYEFSNPATNTTFAITATDGYLALGSGDMIRQYLRSTATSNPKNQAFYQSDLFAELRKQTPANAYAYSIADIQKYVKFLIKIMDFNSPISSIPKASQTNAMFPNFDKSKLPSAEYLSKFFGYLMGYGVPTDKGFKTRLIISYGNTK